MPTQVIACRNSGDRLSCHLKLASREQLLVSITRHPTPSIKVVRLALFGTIPCETIWEYSPTMARGPAEMLDLIGESLFECSSVHEMRRVLAERENGGPPRPQRAFFEGGSHVGPDPGGA